jgi:hypothetical protein
MKKMSLFLFLSILYYGCKPQTINKIEQSKEVVKKTPELASIIQFPPNTKFVEKNTSGVKSVDFYLPEGFYMVITDETGKKTGYDGGEIKCSCTQPKGGGCEPFINLADQTMGCIKEGCTTCSGTINGRVMSKVNVDIRIGRLKDWEMREEASKKYKEQKAKREDLNARLGRKKAELDKSLITPILSYTEMLKMENADEALLKDPAIKKEVTEIKAAFWRYCDNCPKTKAVLNSDGSLPDGYVLVPINIKGKKTNLVAPYQGVLGTEFEALLPTSFKGSENRSSYPPSGLVKYKCSPNCCRLFTQSNQDGEIEYVQCKECTECTLSW